MKSKDIVVGEDYEAIRYGNPHRCTVLAVGKKTRRVYSGARWDMGGHASTAVVVTVRWAGDTEAARNDITPQQVKRPWSEAAAEHDAKNAAKGRKAAAIEALRGAGFSAGEALLGKDRISVYLSVEEAERFVARLERD